MLGARQLGGAFRGDDALPRAEIQDPLPPPSPRAERPPDNSSTLLKRANSALVPCDACRDQWVRLAALDPSPREPIEDARRRGTRGRQHHRAVVPVLVDDLRGVAS